MQDNYIINLLNTEYKNKYGISRDEIVREYFSFLSYDVRILEVGCHLGAQLSVLKEHGFKDLWGIENDSNVISKAKMLAKDVNIINASLTEMPFKDNYFDLVFTSGILVDFTEQEKLLQAMNEIIRVSKKYIFGLESFDTDFVSENEINVLSVREYFECFKEFDPKLKLIQERFMPYKDEDKMDVIYLLGRE